MGMRITCVGYHSAHALNKSFLFWAFISSTAVIFLSAPFASVILMLSDLLCRACLETVSTTMEPEVLKRNQVFLTHEVQMFRKNHVCSCSLARSTHRSNINWRAWENFFTMCFLRLTLICLTHDSRLWLTLSFAVTTAHSFGLAQPTWEFSLVHNGRAVNVSRCPM